MKLKPKYKSDSWWNAPKGRVNEDTLKYVRSVENRQAIFYWGCRSLEATIDQNPRTNPLGARYRFRGGHGDNRIGNDAQSVTTENLIVQQINTAAAFISDTDVTIRIQTDNADWSHRRNAKRLQFYANGLMSLYDILDTCQYGFQTGAALKGTAVNKVSRTAAGGIEVRSIPIENIIVDELECRDMRPLQLHHREFYDRDRLIAEFPEFAQEIYRAHDATEAKWAGYRPIDRNEVCVIESWRLPIGKKGKKGYVAGRHTICIKGTDLVDEEYEDSFFPFAFMRWDKPVNGFYGHGLAERIFPIQTLLNKRNWQIDRGVDNQIQPTIAIHKNDRDLAVKSFSRVGMRVITYRHQKPESIEFKAVSQEIYADPARLQAMAERQNGVNQMMISGNVPNGVQTGEAVRQVRITHSQRFSLQQKAYERFIKDTVWLALAMCKKLAPAVPDILKVAKYGGINPKNIKWDDVNLDDLREEMQVASSTTETPAGRQARITEMAQAGIIPREDVIDLVDDPDIEKKLSAYTANSESLQWVIERIEDEEEGIVPEPFQDLDMGIRMLQAEYLQIQPQGAPEGVLEALSDWVSIAANMKNPANMNAAPGTPGMPAPGQPPMNGNALPPAAMAQLQAQPGAPSSAFAAGAYAPMAVGQ